MMFDINHRGRRATKNTLGALLISLFLAVNLGWAQEAPRPEGSSQIKPPMIKPPMQKSQGTTSGSVKASTRRRKTTKRKRRGRRSRAAIPVPSATPGETNVAGSAPPNTGTASIKPPMANEGNVSLSTSTGEKKPVSGGVLNGRAITLPKPVYPAIAKSARASGTVTVEVLIGEDGNVISARAVSGHPLLQEAARQAALEARFSPTTLEGKPVQVSGVITYQFVP